MTRTTEQDLRILRRLRETGRTGVSGSTIRRLVHKGLIMEIAPPRTTLWKLTAAGERALTEADGLASNA